jgi:glycosyltransferase involved in cell wall biosynthesis
MIYTAAPVPPEISIVVPARNEEENIAPLCEALIASLGPLSRSYEILLVDDGSSDGTQAAMQAARRRHGAVRILRLDGPRGQTAALDAGFRHARGPVVVTLDADLQNDPADIPALIEALDGCDAVAGVRTPRRDSALRRLSAWVAGGVRDRMLGIPATDIGCTLKVYRVDALRGLPLHEGMHRFLNVLLVMNGRRVKEMPVRHHPRRAGRSKYGVWNRMWKGMADLLAVRWMMKRRLRYTATEVDP